MDSKGDIQYLGYDIPNTEYALNWLRIVACCSSRKSVDPSQKCVQYLAMVLNLIRVCRTDDQKRGSSSEKVATPIVELDDWHWYLDGRRAFVRYAVVSAGPT